MKKIFYAQSGGVTAVINTTAAGVLSAAKKLNIPVMIGKNGILGGIHHDLFDASVLTEQQIHQLSQTPGGAFGSCRHKLKSPDTNLEEYQALVETFKKEGIDTFFYNGGNDSMDTAHKVAVFCKEQGLDIKCLGLPKTIDNDLVETDCCPGFGSVAKYVAISTREAAMDLASMAKTSTKVFILEVMGRHAGWITAAAGLATQPQLGHTAPHLLLFPEKTFNPEDFLKQVQKMIELHGHCVVVASEGIRNANGQFVAESGTKDAFGHAQLGGVAPYLAGLVKDGLKQKVHWATSDYLQRSARHIASKTDFEQAFAVGEKGVEFAQQGLSGVMVAIKRISANNQPYQYELQPVDLALVANHEKMMPEEFFTIDGYHITCLLYTSPSPRDA
jgi:6-phosphofructokinase